MLRFFLLDIGEEKTAEGSEIWLWGADDQGKNILLVDRSFRPYFYAICREDSSAEKLSEILLSSRSRNENALDVSIIEKRLFGRKVKAVKITSGSSETLEATARCVAKHELVEQVLGDDIRHSSLYLFDRGVIPCRWHEAEVERLHIPDLRVDSAYLAASTPQPIALERIPELRVLAFSPIAFAERGSPHASQDPVSIIAVATSDGKAQSFCRSDASDHDVILGFTDFLMKFDPDIVAGFESNGAGWPFLIERARKSGAALAVSRVGSRPHTSVYGHISIAGRVGLDILDYADELPEVKVKTVENVAAFLGIRLEPVLPDELKLANMWKTSQDRHLLMRCAKARASAILEMTKRFLEFGTELSSLTSVPLDQVATAAVGYRVDSYLIKEAYRQNHLIPPRREQVYERYQGAIVLAPSQGLHENVVALDFASMYPNLMILYNLSPDTYVRSGERIDDESCWIIQDLGYKFKKTPPGLYKTALTNLISARNDVKLKLENSSLSDSDGRILREREKERLRSSRMLVTDTRGGRVPAGTCVKLRNLPLLLDERPSHK